jgi:hypothetical protein
MIDIFINYVKLISRLNIKAGYFLSMKNRIKEEIDASWMKARPTMS